MVNATDEHTAEVEALWRAVSEPLRGFVGRRVATPEDAEDILQDVFVRVHAGIDALRDEERLVSWVYRIARNAIIDHYRSAPRRREVPAAVLPELDETWRADEADAAAETRAELVGCLRPAIAALPPDAREALELTELGELTQAEAAARLGISVSGMKSRVQRGRRRVRTLMEECCALVFDGRGAPIERECRTACCPA